MDKTLKGLKSLSIRADWEDGAVSEHTLSPCAMKLLIKVFGLKRLCREGSYQIESISDERARKIMDGIIDPIKGTDLSRSIEEAKHFSVVVDEDFRVHILGLWEDDEENDALAFD